jgi:predicted DNA binding CopG/RHH family protein
MALDTRLQVRMTQDEIEELKEQAEDNGFTVSDYIRYLVENDKGGEE